MLGLSLAEQESTHALPGLCRLIQSLVDPSPLTWAQNKGGSLLHGVAAAAASSDLMVLRASLTRFICFHLQKMADELDLLPGDRRRGKHKHKPHQGPPELLKFLLPEDAEQCRLTHTNSWPLKCAAVLRQLENFFFSPTSSTVANASSLLQT